MPPKKRIHCSLIENINHFFFALCRIELGAAKTVINIIKNHVNVDDNLTFNTRVSVGGLGVTSEAFCQDDKLILSFI